MSSPPASSSSSLPSPSRRTAPVSSQFVARVVFGPGQIQVVPEALLFNELGALLHWRGARQMGCALIAPVGVWTAPLRGLRWDPGATRQRVRRQLSPAPPVFEGGPSGLHVFSPGSGRPLPSITIRQGLLEILRAEEAAGSSTGAPGFVAPSAQEVEELAWGLRQATESESCWREWLLRDVAGARLETLGWAREHRLLLDGLSLGVSYVVEELAGQATAPRVVQGAGRLSRLMEAHRHRSFIETGTWLEAFVDGLRTPPLLEEIVQAAWELLEVEFGPGGGLTKAD
ncbi:hypothetical protein C0992_004532 [Termitomyces sp. T32_za158]|nr:hypothetical protein C0992_004532 [Termitomyces sp. T32_za158]